MQVILLHTRRTNEETVSSMQTISAFIIQSAQRTQEDNSKYLLTFQLLLTERKLFHVFQLSTKKTVGGRGRQLKNTLDRCSRYLMLPACAVIKGRRKP